MWFVDYSCKQIVILAVQMLGKISQNMNTKQVTGLQISVFRFLAVYRSKTHGSYIAAAAATTGNPKSRKLL